MVKTKIIVDDRKAFRKLNRVKRNSLRAAIRGADDLAELGKYRAKSVAPYYSGRTAKFIRVIKTRKSDGAENYIVSPNSAANDGHPRNIANFNLPRWMHTSPKAARHIKSGDRRYMYSTAQYLNRIKKGVAQGHFNKIVLR